MRFGLDRMHKLMTALGMPQRRFASIHVVGSNGKSSTVRFIAAILERHGLRTGTYTSPHLRSFSERIEVGGAGGGAASASPRRSSALRRRRAIVERTLDPDDAVTQFEALTAAAYHELAARGVEVAVIEAGLGGRYDATNVIPSQVQVLTGVGLGAHALAGPDDHGHRRREAGGGARPRDARGGRPGPRGAAPWPSAWPRSAARAWSPRRREWTGFGCARRARSSGSNFAVAVAAAEAFLGRPARAERGQSGPPPKPASPAGSTWWRNGR